MENEELSSPASAQTAPASAAAQSETASIPQPEAASLPVSPPFDPRRRIRELLAIAERDRTDAEWDELNELEIQTAPGNRLGGPSPMGHPAKPGFHHKNRMKGKGRAGSGRSQGGGNKPPHNNKPRP